MLAPKHRLTTSQDYSAVMRRGFRAGTTTVVVSVLLTEAGAGAADPSRSAAPWRCGFIVSKAVGNAVTRHRTTRRLRHIVRELITSEAVTLPGQGRAAIVIRALAESAEADHATLTEDVRSGLRRAAKKAQRASA